MNKRLFAIGRLKPGQLNKTERAYQSYLEKQKQEGKIQDFWFESIKIKIAENSCWYLPDFLVLTEDGTLELHEVKGSPHIFTDDAKVKVKVAASTYPFRLFVVFPRPKKDGGGWIKEEY